MRPLTPAEVDAVFLAMIGMRGKIPFGFIKEGCEVRSQLMIDVMIARGIDPGRAWALAVPGKTLSVQDPSRPGQLIRWGNHTAPTVAIDASPHGIRVIDPSLPGVRGPLTIEDWAAALKLTVWERPGKPLSQAEMLNRFAHGTMKGQDLGGFIYVVERGVSPVSDIPGSGFRIGPDPLEGVAAFVLKETKRLLKEQARNRLAAPP
jgi:hypothetical protein